MGYFIPGRVDWGWDEVGCFRRRRRRRRCRRRPWGWGLARGETHTHTLLNEISENKMNSVNTFRIQFKYYEFSYYNTLD